MHCHLNNSYETRLSQGIQKERKYMCHGLPWCDVIGRVEIKWGNFVQLHEFKDVDRADSGSIFFNSSEQNKTY